jgi:hypothetical protein
VGGDFIENEDFALIAFKVGATNVVPAPLVPEAERIETGQFVAAVGHPNMERGKSALWDSSEGRVINFPAAGLFHTATVEHGSSGGGLFDGHGHLIGVNVSLTPHGEAQAVDLRPLTRSFTFDFMEVPADRTHWQVSPVTVEVGQRVWIYAIGVWEYSAAIQNHACDAGGSSEYPDFKLVRQYPFASLLYMTDERDVRSITDTSWGQALPLGGKGVCGERFSHSGNLQFRINHNTEGRRPEGAISVIVIRKTS